MRLDDVSRLVAPAVPPAPEQSLPPWHRMWLEKRVYRTRLFMQPRNSHAAAAGIARGTLKRAAPALDGTQVTTQVQFVCGLQRKQSTVARKSRDLLI